MLIRFILFRLSKVSVYEIKWLLVALKMLCEGRESVTQGAGSPTQFDYNAVAAVLKSAKHPEPNSKSISSSSCTSVASSATGTEKESPKSEIKRSRSDLSTVILQQLLAPLEPGKMTWVPLSEEISDCTVSKSPMSILFLQIYYIYSGGQPCCFIYIRCISAFVLTYWIQNLVSFQLDIY